jgi:hypothetical protein
MAVAAMDIDTTTVLVTMAFVEQSFNLPYITNFNGGNFCGFINIFFCLKLQVFWDVVPCQLVNSN